MPCQTFTTEESLNMKLDSIRGKYANNEALLCYLLNHIEIKKLHPTLFRENKNLENWYVKHSKKDLERNIKHYEKLYPNFNSRELEKMILNNVLKPI